ncbi:XRE family transcriptional regulator [Streptomyces sp. RKAG337]|uniref:XRE family transcriptional regulator n=1 Tax=Streptomyces sp. RKAG337 TaxID=2893404 RepID=UPI002033D289|nr:XRE family transcriptional regulator [Streptomyces sp. RKAG337]MCM2427347.1 XRE family transcriptional regulator [Streptomyces sp. RKAG337]
MTNLFRKGDGEPIRKAMRAAKLSGPRLAAATRVVDPEGKGLSAAAIGRITGKGQTAQEGCRLRSAWLVADALDEPLQHLFSRTPMTSGSTSTVERSRTDAD